jgi:hypothetical protein
MTCDGVVAAHLIPQRPPPTLSNFGSDPEIQGDAVALFKHFYRGYQSPTDATGPAPPSQSVISGWAWLATGSTVCSSSQEVRDTTA